ncbi:MAG: Gfo/Idh/MocA family protein [Opitutaceae bacterium]
MAAPSQNVLVIGCGGIGERHVRCLLRTGRARVTACDADAGRRERIAATYGVPATGDAAEAIAANGTDAVVICTPAHTHVPLARAALAAGRHVLIEKPLSTSLDAVAELIAERDSSGRQAAVAYVYHVFPFLVAAREFINRREFGPVREVTAVSGQCYPAFRPDYREIYYRDRATGGGAIQDAITHVVNWVESVIGPADRLTCDCSRQVLEGVNVEDTVHLTARHGSVLANYALNQFQAPNENVVQFNAAGGSVRIELHRQRWGTFAAGASDWTWHDAPVPERDSHFIAQANAFLDQIEGHPAKLCSLESAAQTLRFNLAALASAETGTRVEVR